MEKVKLNKIFECEGNLYSIAVGETATFNSNLADGRSIFEFIILNE
tara:strand:+ start:180957 stop:181094 length:138 start_codon:yes stop_codon:yes gene_type:complete